MKTQPETIKDLVRMEKTSSGWFDGQISSKPIERSDYPQVGDVCGITTHIRIYGDMIEVFERTSWYSEKHSRGGFSVDCKTNWRKQYTFEEFKNSEWWEVTLDAFKGGDCDSSSFDSFIVEKYDDGVYIEHECEEYYRDWLGNYRLSKSHDTLSISTNISGDFSIKYGQNMWEGSIEDLMELIEYGQTLKQLGVDFDGRKNVLEVKLIKEGEDG